MSQEGLDKIYSVAEAADRLRLSNRALIKVARKHGHCSRFGRDYLFSEADLLAIWQVLREPAKEPRRAVVQPGLSDRQLRESLLKLSRKKRSK
ncbi:hypothetical protein JZX86_18030 [Agrobacterium rosae]|uniref:hypothetical protein n=1 Tax=Agrobacterium rosae TaxID=1972867 RepID=UPI0019D340E9|nr:hypothetical protein [Agrobacterium rosae]MBN7807255.1 hypothetical protein [Agrobacterium rosae]